MSRLVSGGMPNVLEKDSVCDAVGQERDAGGYRAPTIALERDTNPFMRAASIAELAERRAAKDNFKG